MLTYTQYKQILKPIAKPCAFLNLDALHQNIKKITSSSNGKSIRIASKSIRSVPVLREILSSSSIFKGIMCYSANEALFLADQGFDDLLIAYPVWNEEQLTEICVRVKQQQTITVMVDSTEHINRLHTIARKNNGKFLVCIDTDLSSHYPGLHFGVYRSPIKSTERAIAVAHQINDSRYLELDGIMGYEAQIAGVPDATPNKGIKNNTIRILKKQSSQKLKMKRVNLINAFQQEGFSLRFVNGGGTGSLHQTVKEPHVTEVSVGSAFFSPHLFDNYRSFQYEPALGYAIEVIRIPQENIYTCSGGGYVASGTIGKDRLPQILLPAGAKLTRNEGAGEVQTPVYYEGKEALEMGDPIILRHSKAGELCEHFQHLQLIKDGNLAGTFTTYRGDHQCFL